jgi:hypothetical protein
MQADTQTASGPTGHHVRLKTRSVWTRNFESATAHALTQGGDTRIELNATGTNSYGCRPLPDPALLQFGSSTGSVISVAGFQAATALYRRLYAPAGSYSMELERQRRELSLLSGASGLPGTEVVFAASGTDIHLFAAHLAAQGKPTPLQAVMVEPSETGSGVPAALAALHFATQTSQGHRVNCGEALAHSPLQRPASVALRHADGRLRRVDEVDAEFAAHVARSVQAAGGCLLVLTDLSKTGLLAPSLACAAQLRALYGERLSVLVDACQFRLSSETLLGYLAQEFMVAITGSKFVGGPAFCGALLLPPSVAQCSRAVPLNTLVAYSARSDWPPDWLPATALAESANLGLLLRWEAALTELRRFKALPDQAVHDFLQTWQAAVSQRIASDDSFEALPVAPLQRRLACGLRTWDSVQTIIPFQIFKRTASGAKQALSLDETALLYRRLNSRDAGTSHGLSGTDFVNARFQLGQPVSCGQSDAVPVSALRMCSSARLVADAILAGQPVDRTIAHAMLAFDKLVMLAQALR